MQTIVRASEHGGELKHLDPLSGNLQGHVLGETPEELLVFLMEIL